MGDYFLISLVRKPYANSSTLMPVTPDTVLKHIAETEGIPLHTYEQLQGQGKTVEQIGQYAGLLASLAREQLGISKALHNAPDSQVNFCKGILADLGKSDPNKIESLDFLLLEDFAKLQRAQKGTQ